MRSSGRVREEQARQQAVWLLQHEEVQRRMMERQAGEALQAVQRTAFAVVEALAHPFNLLAMLCQSFKPTRTPLLNQYDKEERHLGKQVYRMICDAAWAGEGDAS